MGDTVHFETKTEEPEIGTWKKIRNYFREYCVCSSIHGFRYFGEKRTYFERFWWFVVFSLAVGVCSYLIREVYHKWDRSPVIVSFATSETQIHTIPFPAVTICPEAKTQQYIYNHSLIIQKVLHMEKNLTLLELLNALKMSLVCDVNTLNVTELFSEELEKPQYQTTNSTEFFEFLEFGKTVDDVLMSGQCFFMGKQHDCSQLFVPLITDEGICYTFNILDRSEIFRDTVIHYKDFHKVQENESSWNMEDGYVNEDNENADLQAYPHRALFAGIINHGP